MGWPGAAELDTALRLSLARRPAWLRHQRDPPQISIHRHAVITEALLLQQPDSLNSNVTSITCIQTLSEYRCKRPAPRSGEREGAGPAGSGVVSTAGCQTWSRHRYPGLAWPASRP